MAFNGNRDTYLDSVKTVLIYGVILTHCIMRLGGVRNHDLTDIIAFDFLTLIIIPLFVFVSGYFSNPDKSVRKSCLGIFSAFILFQIIWRIMSPPSSLKALLSPAPTLWYLLSLCFWRVFIHEMNKYIKKKWILLALSFVIMIIAGFIPLSRECSFQRTFAFFPLFVLGNMMRGTDVVSWMKAQNKYLSGMILLAFMMALFFHHPNYYWLNSGLSSFYAYHCDFALAPFVKIGWFLLALFIGTVCLCLIPDSKILSSQGDKTLTVYLFHVPYRFLGKDGCSYRSYFNINGFSTGDLSGH